MHGENKLCVQMIGEGGTWVEESEGGEHGLVEVYGDN